MAFAFLLFPDSHPISPALPNMRRKARISCGWTCKTRIHKTTTGTCYNGYSVGCRVGTAIKERQLYSSEDWHEGLTIAMMDNSALQRVLC